MKHTILWSCLWVLLGIACKQAPRYEITAEFPGAPDGVTFYLACDAKTLDSATFSGWRMTLKGVVEAPVECLLSTCYENNGRLTGKMMMLWVENSRIRITCPWDSLPDNSFYGGPQTIVSGSASHDVYGAYQTATGELRRQVSELASSMLRLEHAGVFTPENTRLGIEKAKKYNALNREITRREKELMARYPASPVTLRVFADMLQTPSRLTLEEVDALFHGLDTTLQRRPEWAAMQKAYEIYRRTACGELYTDFALTDEKGAARHFSDYFQPGKYHLLVCWASWCHPCRMEIPHLKHIHAVCGDRFPIIAVSADKDPAAWQKAVREEQPGYVQLRMAKDDRGETLASYYGLKGIPYTLVLDGKGRVVASGVFGGVLDALLADWYGDAVKEL